VNVPAVALAWASVAALASAQVPAVASVVDLELEPVRGEAPVRCAELRGCALLLAFAAVDADGPAELAASLAALDDDLGDQGLWVVLVAPGPREAVARFADRYGVRFACAVAAGLPAACGAEALPAFAQVGPDGRLAAPVGPDLPTRAELNELVARASLLPPPPRDGARLLDLREAWAHQRYARVLGELARLRGAEPTPAESAFLDGVERAFGRVAMRAGARIAALARGPDYWRSSVALEEFAARFEGTAPGCAALAELERLRSDPVLSVELAAARELAVLQSRFDGPRELDRRRLREELWRFARRHRGTWAAGEARTRADRVLPLAR
jgi:hypothetical protein